MKKLFLTLFALVMATSSLWAYYNFESSGIYYYIIDKELRVTGTSKTSGEIRIPSTVYYRGTTYTVTEIGSYAFYGCTGLTSIEVNADNPNYSSLDGILYNKDKTKLITYPGGKQGYFAILESVTEIGSSAFYGCTGLTSVTIPESVTDIGDDAFRDCTGLTSITIPKSVTSIDDYAFKDCSELTTVNFNAINCTTMGSYSFPVFKGCSNLTTVNIGENVTTIPPVAFYNCTGLTEITIPNSVTKIGNYAFKDCTGLTSVTIPESVTEIGVKAFLGTPWFNNQPDDVIYINKVLYTYKGTMPVNTSIEIKEGTVSISPSAFYGYTGLTSVTIPNSVTTIGDDAFYNTPWYNNQPNGVIYINKVLYKYKGTMPVNTSIEIKEGTVSITGYAFYNCTGLTSVTIPNSVTEIGNYAFKDCTGLTSVTIPNNVTSIGKSAFYGVNLKDLTILDGETEIDLGSSFPIDSVQTLYMGRDIKNATFQNNKRLTDLTIGDKVTAIGDLFKNCTTLTSLTICDRETDLEIDLTTFSASSIQTLYLGRRLPNITFQGSKTLTDLTVSIDYIESSEFSNCEKLKTLTLTDKVEMVRNSAFEDCPNLTELTIGSGVTRIGTSAFGGCDNIRTIYCKPTTPPLAASTTFTSLTQENAILYVPTGCEPVYKATEPWKYFWDIRELETLGVEDVLAESTTVTVQGGAIVVTGLDTPMNIEVYNLQGQRVYCGYETTIPVNERGIYLVRIANRVVKVVL